MLYLVFPSAFFYLLDICVVMLAAAGFSFVFSLDLELYKVSFLFSFPGQLVRP